VAPGVGYDVTISVTTFSALPAKALKPCCTSPNHVREEQIALFGFSENPGETPLREDPPHQRQSALKSAIKS